MELTKESYFLASVNDSSLKTKGTTDNVSTDTATKKSTDGSETSKAASGKDDKEEPMDVDNSAEKEEKSKNIWEEQKYLYLYLRALLTAPVGAKRGLFLGAIIFGRWKVCEVHASPLKP